VPVRYRALWEGYRACRSAPYGPVPSRSAGDGAVDEPPADSVKRPVSYGLIAYISIMRSLMHRVPCLRRLCMLCGQEAELPWQVIYIGDPRMVENLQRHQQWHDHIKQQVLRARSAHAPPRLRGYLLRQPQ
jgi:hypothetical protein